MKNLLSHLIHLTFITEFEIFFYIYYIVPFERENIYKMFDSEYNYNFVSYNISNSYNNLCNKEEERMEEYNNKLNIICYYYIGCVNFLLLIAFLYDLRKNYCFYFGNNEMPRVLSSPKYLSAAFSIEMVDIEADVVSENKEKEKEIKNKTDERFIVYYWKNSRFIAKMCETIQLIILLGVFEYIFFTYLFNKFKIVSAKLVLCKLLN
jgi:hypothetical protein